MAAENYERVHIIGSGGSGKTTLARKLAVILDASYYELDHIGYENGAKRSLEVRYEDVRRIASQPTWVSEGGFVWWVDDLLQPRRRGRFSVAGRKLHTRVRQSTMNQNIQDEQVAYYRARAGEYDEWFRRDGRYDRGPEANARWAEEIASISDALAAFNPAGDVLELAAGTGWWTERLARYAASVTAVDASPETLAINRGKLGDASVRYMEADLFEWQPDRQYDVIFFSFWLSHVPLERFDAFWGLVRSCLKPNGRVFFLDSRYSETSTAADHRLEGEDATTTLRRLNDGREFRIVKVFYQPDDLAARLAALGWGMTVRTTPNHFLYGSGAPAL